MKTIQKYSAMMVVVYTITVMISLFVIVNITNNGYNPYVVACENACFKNLQVEVRLDKSGDAHFTEEFKAYREKSGEFVYLDHEYNEKYGEQIDEASIRLESNNGQLRPEVQTSDEKKRVRFKIFTTFAGEKTFKMSYTVRGFIKQLKDGQIFKYVFFDNSKGRPVLDARFIIHLPQEMKPVASVYFNSMKSQDSIIYDEKKKTYTFDVPQQLHTKPYYEINMGFSENLFEYTIPIPNAQYQSIEAFNQEVEKLKMADDTITQRGVNTIIGLLVFFTILSGLLIIGLFMLYVRKGRQHRKVHTDIPYWDIPADIGPAAAAMVVNPSNRAQLSNAFKAGILYLVSEGYIEMEEVAKNCIQIKKQKELSADVLPREIEKLYEYLFARKNVKVIYKSEVLKAESLEAKRFNEYKMAAIAAFQNLDLFDVDTWTPNGEFQLFKNKNGSFAMKMLVVLVMNVLILLAFVFYDEVAAVMMIGIGALALLVVIVVLYYVQLTRLREDKIHVYEKWVGYKLYLSTYTLLRERTVTDVAIWKKHLVYATAFGEAEKVLAVLSAEFPDIYAEVNMTISMLPLFYSGSFFDVPANALDSLAGDSGFGGGSSFGGGGFDGGGSGGGGGGFG